MRKNSGKVEMNENRLTNEKKNTIFSLNLGLKLKIPVSVALILVLLVVYPRTTRAVTVLWEDDFDGEDLAGWEVATYYSPDFDAVGVVKGMTLISNTDHKMLLSHPDESSMNVAERNSTQVYGHWSFDVDITAGCHGSFAFMFRDTLNRTDFEGWYNQLPVGFAGYGVGIYTELVPNVLLGRFTPDFINSGPDKSPPEDFLLDFIDYYDYNMDFSLYGEIHVDITRTPGGNITVFFNSYKIMSAIDTVYNTSEVINISSFVYTISFDNIKIDNNYSYVPEDWKPPPPKDGLTDLVELALIVFTGVVIVVFVWWFVKKGRKD